MFLFTSQSIALSTHLGKGAHRIVTLAILILTSCAASLSVTAQIAPKATDKSANPKPVTQPRVRLRSPRSPRSGNRGSVSEESDNFLDLGDDFALKSKWKAAEAAYKEAIRLSPGNSDALAALGYLYVD